MASDLDAFVLQYSVDLRDSLARLSKLQEAMEKTSQTHEKSIAGVKELASHFQGISRTLDGATGALGKFLSAAGPVAGAMTAIGLSVKFVTDQIAEYNANLKLAYGTGIDLTSLEGVRRSLTASGNVDRATVDTSLGNIASMVRAARLDPTGADAYKLRMMGGDPYGSVQGNLGSIGANFQGMSREQAEALGTTYGGLDPRMVDTLRAAGTDAGKVQMSDEDIANIAQYNENLKELNKTFNEGKSAVKNLAVNASADLINFFKELPDELKNALHGKSGSTGTGIAHRFLDYMAIAGMGGAGDAETTAAILDDAKKSKQQQTQKLVTKAKQETTQQQQIFDAGTMYMRAAALFASSVNSFTHTIGEQEMNALLAGEAGAASGAGGSPSSVNGTSNGGGSTFVPATGPGSSASRGIRNNNPGNIRFGDFAKSQGATGADDKGFAIFPTMAQGYSAMGNLIGGKSYFGGGLNTISAVVSKYAPSSENDTKSYIASVSKATNLDPNKPFAASDLPKIQAAMALHESGFKSDMMIGNGHWVATPGKSFNLAGGNSLDRQRFLGVAGAIAAGMHVSGVTGAGILQGQFSRGDVDLGYQRALTSAKANVYKAYQAAYAPGLNAFQRKAAMTSFQQAAMNERSLENYSSQILGRARAGGQELTTGQTVNIDASNISINVTGGIPDQAQFKRRVTQILHESVQQALNEQVSANKA